MRKFIGLHADFFGSLTAMICALHCMAIPVLISFGLVSNSFHNHTFDVLFLGSGLGIGLYVFIKDYLKNHKNILPSITAFIGFSSLILGIQTHGELYILNVLGGLIIVLAHLYNWKLSHS